MRRQRGAMRDVPVGDRSAASGVRDDAVFGRQLGYWHVPQIRRGEQEPFARLGAGQLQVVAAVLHRRRSVGPHAPIEAVRNPGDAGSIASAERWHAAAPRVGRAVARDRERPRGRLLARVAVGRGVLGTDLRPVALQFLAHHHRVRRPDALTELGLRDPDRNSVVGCHHDPGVDFGGGRLLVPGSAGRRRGRCLRLRLRVGLRRHPEAEHESALRGGHRGQELAAGDVGVHLTSPSDRRRGGWLSGCGNTCRIGRRWSLARRCRRRWGVDARAGAPARS